MFTRSPLQHFLAFMTAIVVGIPLMAWALPASWYFEASVEVPDHVQGEDPTVKYMRTIKRTQRMDFLVEVRSIDSKRGNQFCLGGGSHIYAKDEPIALPLPLSRYTGNPECVLPTGLYVMDTCWTYHVLVFDKTYCARSNVFKVSS